MTPFVKNNQGFLISVELAMYAAILIPTALLGANVLVDLLNVWIATYQNHIEVMCAALPIPKPDGCNI